MSVYNMIRDSLPHTVPYARRTGIELADVGDGIATAKMSQTHDNSNHMGTVHSGALFTLAETAAGAAIAGAFAPFLMKGLKAFPTDLSIKYKTAAKGAIKAEACIPSNISDTRVEISEDGKARVTVSVVLSSQSGEVDVGSAESEWKLKLG